MGAIFWWLLRRRRAQQFSMPSKESSRSVEQHQPSFKETHQVNQGQERQTGYINEISSVISRPSQTVVRHFANKSLNSISSANLPSQYPTFPSPTPRDRKPNIINGIIDLSSSPSLESSPIPQQPPLPDSILECASPMTEIALPPNDFYIDMLGIGTDDNHINYNLKAEAPNISASPSPISSPVPLPPPMSPRSRSSSIASLRKCSEIARLAGNSPKLSRDARQMVQQFPPPPPPPQVPPPAIPDDIESLLSYSRFNRSRAGTASSESKMPLNQYWESSTPSGSRPSSYASNSSRRDAPPTKSRRPASRSASLSRKVTDPNQRPLSVSQPLPEQLSQLQDGRRPLQSHRRSQSNIYSGGSTPSMDALDRSLSMSPAQIRAPSILPRPILRHNNSYSDQSSSDSAQEVEDIISDALAITVAKRQSDRISLDVDSTQDLSPYS
ncbi:hypothetical protein FBU30_010833 [Linnemannia zychae]|nr:hypothetical protein FBU30_010833 [Linnemannia zychae]